MTLFFFHPFPNFLCLGDSECEFQSFLQIDFAQLSPAAETNYNFQKTYM